MRSCSIRICSAGSLKGYRRAATLLDRWYGSGGCWHGWRWRYMTSHWGRKRLSSCWRWLRCRLHITTFTLVFVLFCVDTTREILHFVSQRFKTDQNIDTQPVLQTFIVSGSNWIPTKRLQRWIDTDTCHSFGLFQCIALHFHQVCNTSSQNCGIARIEKNDS